MTTSDGASDPAADRGTDRGTGTDVAAGGTRHSEIFDLADEFVRRLAELDPVTATALGITDHDDRLTSYAPDALEERAAMARQTLQRLASAPVVDDLDRVAAAVMTERLEADLLLHEAGDDLRAINVLWSPMHQVRQAFELMPAGDGTLPALVSRLGAVPDSLASWRAAIATGQRRGQSAARRQALAVAAQADSFAGAGSGAGWFQGLAGRVAPGDAAAAVAARGADAAYGELARWLRESYAPAADESDAVGPERYLRASRVFNGADLDLKETWEWGWAELESITERMRSVAERVRPGATPIEAKAALDADPAYVIDGTDALLEFLAGLTERATEEVAGRWFDIDQAIRHCDVMIAAEGSAAAPYYMPPSEDLSRPGSTWFPTRGRTTFPRWWLVTVWYHEGVPGHHLQIATALVERQRLSRFQRTLGNTSGYAEGWALYAERLMDELGYFDDPGIELGYLSAQAMRAVRVVVDIGLHTGLERDGVAFTPASAREFLRDRALLEDDFAASEVDRYLGMPGQAISYKVGERYWLRAREEAQRRLGAGFDLRDWHMHALRLGPMGLDPFAREVAAYGRPRA